MTTEEKFVLANKWMDQLNARFDASGKNEREFFQDPSERRMLKNIQTIREYAHLELSNVL